MSDEQRHEVVEWLVIWTGWARSAFEKLADRELLELYERHDLNRG